MLELRRLTLAVRRRSGWYDFYHSVRWRLAWLRPNACGPWAN